MTIPNEVVRSGPYNTNGVVTAFPYTFKVLDKSQVVFTMTNVVTAVVITLVVDVDFTVSGVGVDVGGNATTTIVWPAGYKAALVRKPLFSQLLDLVNQGAFLAEDIEAAFDLITMEALYLKDGKDRGLTLTDASIDGSGQFDGRSNEFINADDGTLPNSLITLQQLTAVTVAAGNVPQPTAPNIGKILSALTATTWGWVSSLAALAISVLTSFNVILDGAATTFRTIDFKTSAVKRWATGADGTAEGGANAGSNWFLKAYSDAGAFLFDVMTVARATGLATFLLRPTWAGGLIPWDSGNFLPIGTNVIINGSMQVCQRPTTVNNPADNTYTLDRWVVRYDGTAGTFSINQGVWANGTPAGRERQTYLNWNQSVVGTSTFRQLRHRVRYVRTLAGQPVSVSFYASADAARAVTMSLLQEFGTGGAPSASVSTALGTANLTTVPTRFKFENVALPSLAGKTLGSNGDDNLSLIFGKPLTVFNINIWDVKVEPGPVCTEFERPSFDKELWDCLSYYAKSFYYGQPPQQNVGGANNSHCTPASATGAAGSVSGLVKLPRSMRAVPTVTLFNPLAANAQARNRTLGTDCTLTAVQDIGLDAFAVTYTCPASTVSGHPIVFNWSAECEL